MFYKYLYGISLWCTIPFGMAAQNTTGGIGGIIKSNSGELLVGAVVKLVHEPTGTIYSVHTRRGGMFDINQVNSGGPYSIEVFLTGYVTTKNKGLYIQLGEHMRMDLVLAVKEHYLGNVTVATERKGKTGMETWIDKERIDALPSVGNNMHDYLRSVPQVKLIAGNEGAVSVAGQNNRFNSFYIDGAVSNDVFGLSASGTNGGQAGISPLPVDAVNQFQLSVFPFDASLGNFTGAGINAVTRSGTNQTEGAVYYFFSNSFLAGKTPGVAKEEAVRLNGFSKQTIGARLQGAVVKNKFFYFVNMDLQRDEHPQPFDLSTYKGNTKSAREVAILVNTLKANYQYDPGSYLDNPELLRAARMVARFDWNLNSYHKLSFSYRHTDGGRTNTNSSGTDIIHFSNDGYFLSAKTRSASFEIKTVLGNRSSNKLLISYTRVADDRDPLGEAFPRVRINDGNGAIVFGTDISSTLNLLLQHNWTLFDKYNFMLGKHTISIGIDCEYNRIYNSFIQNSFGNYTYSSPTDFFRNNGPSFYQSGYSLRDDYALSAAKFSTAKTAFFMHDKIRFSPSLTIHYGLRVDQYFFLTKPAVNENINHTVLPQLAQYWNLEGAQSGQRPMIPVSLSPRIGFIFHQPGKKITVRAGFGVFTGRIPLAWPAGAYLNNGINIGGYAAASAQLNKIRFKPNPYAQWNPTVFNLPSNRIPLDLTTAKFSMPKMARLLSGIEMTLKKNWLVTAEILLSKNLTEIAYKNINLLPPNAHAKGPDSRSVYTITNSGRVPILADGSNPYDHIILLGNYAGKKGYAYNYTFSISHQPPGGLHAEASYHFSSSFAVNDGTSSVSVSQWRFMEAVNGRNAISLSRSDFSGGHRIFALLSKRFRHPGKEISTTLSLSYSGQSGQPFSYVYGNASMVRDDGVAGSNDLIYIPTQSDLAGMAFLPYATATAVYTTDQQKEALEKYISGNPYLKTHRGSYAERNAGRTPFSHTFDLKISIEFRIHLPGKYYRLQLTYDLFNAANFLNREWGVKYVQPFDSFGVIRFAGYKSETDLTPQYQLDPGMLHSSSYSINNSLSPAYSSRWMGQAGIKLIF